MKSAMKQQGQVSRSGNARRRVRFLAGFESDLSEEELEELQTKWSCSEQGMQGTTSQEWGRPARAARAVFAWADMEFLDLCTSRVLIDWSVFTRSIMSKSARDRMRILGIMHWEQQYEAASRSTSQQKQHHEGPNN